MAKRIRKETGAQVLNFRPDIADRPKVDAMLAETEKRLGGVNILGLQRGREQARQDRQLRHDRLGPPHRRVAHRELLPSAQYQGMVARKRGNIVNVSSVAGWIGNPNEKDGEPAYAAAKAALFALIRWRCREVHGIRCNAIAPGLIWPRFVEKFDADFRPLVEATPLRRYGRSDIVEAVMFLASDRRSASSPAKRWKTCGSWVSGLIPGGGPQTVAVVLDRHVRRAARAGRPQRAHDLRRVRPRREPRSQRARRARPHPGDRVAAYDIDIVVAFLGAARLGAIWSASTARWLRRRSRGS